MQKSPLINVIKKVGPAVVSIIISKDLPKIRKYYVQPFDEYLGPYGPPITQYRQEGKQKIKIGGGSGFFVSSDGIIVTNRHVVVSPDVEYTIITPDEKEYQAEILARDPVQDVAILKIKDAKKRKFPILELGDSSKVELGEDVIAIGNPLGSFPNTVSRGVISGLSRLITAHDGVSGRTAELRGLIQTDAAINPGNSGGPLLTLDGKVIAINVAIVMGAQNMGFAIPINNAKKDLEDLKKHGRIIQPFLGVRYILINKELQKEFATRLNLRLPVDHGALIIREPGAGDSAVVSGSPADKAGLREHDIILEFGKKKINHKNPLQEMIHKQKPGSIIEIKILRDDKIGTTSIKLEERK
ncbi:trypsin-like peptidase domain-containing protein [Patescibacteria group bacterium]|nr:trypsin-like peptidase domain-containing protein [Patescibacteria group bacterium]MBU1563690.1 trypsin-like peptidase domain-containing protein [Patescibacteria group bacterium]MBU2068580.1 trypsin-like peptidase domain-containing protein [Patescibacteria group bacterium]